MNWIAVAFVAGLAFIVGFVMLLAFPSTEQCSVHWTGLDAGYGKQLSSTSRNRSFPSTRKPDQSPAGSAPRGPLLHP